MSLSISLSIASQSIFFERLGAPSRLRAPPNKGCLSIGTYGGVGVIERQLGHHTFFAVSRAFGLPLNCLSITSKGAFHTKLS
jgi:hypothetical protein